MPNSQHSPTISAEGLRSYLADVLPASHLSFKQFDGEHEPLVLLKTDHIAAGFGFANGDLRNSFEIAYTSFKRHFSEQKGNWDTLDLAFVFCVRPSFPDLDQFCSNIETDVYFCRKFVVPIADSLGTSLSRLPFLPLAPLEGKPLRPVSAQTLLHQCGVPTVLAKYVVVPGTRGPEGIIEDCIQGEFGELKPLSTTIKVEAGTQKDGNAEVVKLEQITIKNFRAYRKAQTFNLGSDVTVLYGPNGFGKTSFFDAVDFVVTGGIGRVERNTHTNFSQMARHLDANSEESSVRADFQSRGVSRKIIRTVQERNHALLDDRSTDRKAILSELTGRDIPISDRVENFVNLFRATHLFNQELQELTKDFQEKCSLPAEIVSRMLAVQDYANALIKADKISEAITTVVEAADKDIRELTEQISDQAKELARLNPKSDLKIANETLDAQFASLKAKLESAGIETGEPLPVVATTRRWSSLVADKLGESVGGSSRLSELVNELPSLINAKSEHLSFERQIILNETNLELIDKNRQNAEAALQEREKNISHLNSAFTLLQSRAALIEWHRRNYKAYEEASKKRNRLNEQIAQIKPIIQQFRLTEESAAKELLNLNNQSNQANETHKLRQSALTTLQNLAKSLEAWKENNKRETSLVDSEVTLQKALDALLSEEKNFSEAVAKLSEEENRLIRQVEAFDKTQSEFRSLLLQLQGHIQSGVCPLCGENHGTKDHLTERIQKQLKADLASKQREELFSIREKTKQIKDQAAANSQKIASTQTEITRLRQSRSAIQEEVEKFENAAAGFGVSLLSSISNPAEVIQFKIAALQIEVDELKSRATKLAENLERARVESNNGKNALSTKLADETALIETLKRVDQEIIEFKNDKRWSLLSLDTPSDQVDVDEKTLSEQLLPAGENLRKAQSETAKKRAEVAEFQKEAEGVKTKLQALRSQSANLNTTVTKVTTKLREAKLPADSTEESLQALISQETRIQQNLSVLRDSVVSLELALDAATTAAALTTVRQAMRNKEKALAQAKKRREDHKPWLSYFSSIAQLLSTEQHKAIANFTNEYGPRTSTIQRRLRSVYGFDDIEIHSKDSSIEVRVKRHGEELRPTDYFSQSQQQTLLLGLFLTACISQTWSGFSPIFMDDPVTHFDDLNTYAFLDLIVGLLESDSGKRQFIISTCDEKLLQLAIQKFTHLGDRAIFYRFEAIGPDGPIVGKINAQ